MPVRNMIDQPNAARAATSKPHHGGVGRGLVDEHQSGQTEICPGPASSVAVREPRPFALVPPPAGFFLKLILCRSKKRHTALRLPGIRRLRIAATISSSVKSGWSAINASKKSACASSGERLPPLGLGAMLPVSCRRCIHLIAELGLTSNHSAASRRDAPELDRFHHSLA